MPFLSWGLVAGGIVAGLAYLLGIAVLSPPLFDCWGVAAAFLLAAIIGCVSSSVE